MRDAGLALFRPAGWLVASATLMLVLFALFGGEPLFPRGGELRWGPSSLKLVQGAGAARDDGIAFSPTETANSVAAFELTQPFKASEYPFVTLRWHRIGMQTQPILAWSVAEKPNEWRIAPVVWDGGDEVVLRLDGQPGWQGEIVRFGLLLRGRLEEGARLEEAGALPGSVIARLQAWWYEWLNFTGWTGRSINYVEAGRGDATLRPPLVVAIWVGLALALELAWIFWRRLPLRPAVLVGVVLTGWLVLDARWQWELWRQNGLTDARYGGLSWEERQRAALDGPLFSFIQQVKAHMPASPQRVFVLVKDRAGKGEYDALRALYHLLPHNVYANDSVPPAPRYLKPGDFLLQIRANPALGFDPQTGVLTWAGGKARVTPLLFSEGTSVLYRVDPN